MKSIIWVGFIFDGMTCSLTAETRVDFMAGWRQAIELALSEEDVIRLSAVARSRAEPASRVERARILLAYWENQSFFAVAQAIGVLQRCVERALAYGPTAALDDRPRPGKE